MSALRRIEAREEAEKSRGSVAGCADAHSALPRHTDKGCDLEWLRQDRLLYTLEQVGWRRGEPVMQNRLMVSVSGGPNTPSAEIDQLATQVHALLKACVALRSEGSQTRPAGDGEATLSAAQGATEPLQDQGNIT